MLTTEVKSKPIWPLRVVTSVTRGISNILGPLITRNFWTKILVTCAEEMVSAFLIALGGKFLGYGKSRENVEIRRAAQYATGGGASSAFSGGYTSRPEFTPGYNSYGSAFNKGATPAAASPFPGF